MRVSGSGRRSLTSGSARPSSTPSSIRPASALHPHCRVAWLQAVHSAMMAAAASGTHPLPTTSTIFELAAPTGKGIRVRERVTLVTAAAVTAAGVPTSPSTMFELAACCSGCSEAEDDDSEVEGEGSPVQHHTPMQQRHAALAAMLGAAPHDVRALRRLFRVTSGTARCRVGPELASKYGMEADNRCVATWLRSTRGARGRRRHCTPQCRPKSDDSPQLTPLTLLLLLLPMLPMLTHRRSPPASGRWW